MGTWVRKEAHSINWGYSSQLIASVPRGQTLNRVHFNWGFYGTTSGRAAVSTTATQRSAFGICSRSSATAGSPPSPITTPGDVAPPLERWLSYGRPGVVSWRDTGSPAELSTKGQVVASVPSGDTLNVYAVFDTLIPWDTSGGAQFWYWASLLYGS
jgi:hypothetical protein